MRVLVTAFRPFGGMDRNPSWEAIRHLEGARLGGAELRVAELPVSFEEAPRKLREHALCHSPTAIVLFGLAATRRAISLETIARNRNGDSADEGGATAPGAIEPGAVDSLESALPLARIHAALSREGLPVEWSDDAGGYVCNRVFWEARRHLQPPSGFVHVPGLEALALERLRRAAEIVVGEVVGGVEASDPPVPWA